MLLQNKNTVVHGAGGAIGGAVARAFAREGARVFLAGRSLDALETVAKDITAAGGQAHVAQVDALDKEAVDAHFTAIVAEAGSIDVSFNAVGIDHIQATPLVEVDLDDFLHPITAYLRTLFLTSTAAARHMVARGSGVIVTLSSTASRIPAPSDGFGPAGGAIEAYTRQLAAEVGPHGVRAVCLRPHGMRETAARGSHARDIWARFAAAAGTDLDSFLTAPSDSLLGRDAGLDDAANTAVFLASDWANSMTATVTNVSAGTVID